MTNEEECTILTELETILIEEYDVTADDIMTDANYGIFTKNSKQIASYFIYNFANGIAEIDFTIYEENIKNAGTDKVSRDVMVVL